MTLGSRKKKPKLREVIEGTVKSGDGEVVLWLCGATPALVNYGLSAGALLDFRWEGRRVRITIEEQ
jgi:hypothetical protein